MLSRKRLFGLPLLLCLFFMVTNLVFAEGADDQGNPNDPTVNERANACFEGGTMAGKCNIDFDSDGTVEDYEVQWAWECGWYMIRYDSGMITGANVPYRCATLIPAILEEAPAQQGPCYVWVGFGYSWEYIGSANTVGNVLMYHNENCSRAYGDGHLISMAIIFADTEADALAICESLGGGADDLSAMYPQLANAPENGYMCYTGA